MKRDITNTILSRIYTTNENIIGMLQNLEVLMDSNGYQELYNKYLEIAQNIPANETLTEYEKQYENFGTELKYTPVDRALTKFENELEYYNDYKELSDLINDIKNATTHAFDKNASIEEYLIKNKQLIELIINIKNNKTIHQFTKLLDTSIGTVFDSLKILSLASNNELFEFIHQINSNYLNEHLASKVRKSINTVIYKGKLEDDFVNLSTLYDCAMNDEKIIAKQQAAIESEKRQTKLEKERENYLSNLFKEINEQEINIKEYQKKLKELNLNINSLKIKKMLLRLITVPALTIPLACPFIGHSIGKKASSNILLTKTITRTVDADSLDIISQSETYEELNTSYVASVTICEPWKKNLSGASYSRICTVYDYKLEDIEITDDFRLTMENIDANNLVEKYPYEEVSSSILEQKYLTDNQIYVTETYQDFNMVKLSEKYNIPYTVAGAGIGICLGTTELLAYLFLGKKILEEYNENLNHNIEKNKSEVTATNKILKLTLNNQKNKKAEYKSLTNK